jgi:hypothetical protein
MSESIVRVLLYVSNLQKCIYIHPDQPNSLLFFTEVSLRDTLKVLAMENHVCGGNVKDECKAAMNCRES